ncbi:MAG: hypothetical protein IKC72_04865 [Clostridia bacterium]|nr:hypothetical protein [Clostridia bacterium]
MLFSRRMSKKDAKEEKQKQLLPLSEKVTEALAMEAGEVSFGALEDMGATLMHALSELLYTRETDT